MKEQIRKAFAKINLGLDVLGQRPDGYHDLRMIMQTVGLCDIVTLRAEGEPGISLQVRADAASDENSSAGDILPSDERNLAYRAAHLLMEEFALREGVSITLEKHIPVAAGLAGGSADAAAVLCGMNDLFALQLTQEELQQRGLKIGADVPYCIRGGTALAEGIGEQLTALPQAPGAYVLLAKPPFSVSTGYVYAHLKLEEGMEHPDIDAQMQAICSGDFDQMAGSMGNILERVTVPAFPVIGEICEEMLHLGAAGAQMSGSGPAVFGLFDDRGKAERAYRVLLKDARIRDVFLTSFT